jgi:hypothetical protein
LYPDGTAIGTSTRFSPTGGDRGQDVWFRQNGQTIAPINLAGTSYEWNNAGAIHRAAGLQFTSITGHQHVGPIAGHSSRFSTTGSPAGADAWVYNGSATVGPINLTGDVYEWSNAGAVTRRGNLRGANAAGWVTGISSRYSTSGAGKGQDTWLFDGATTRGPINLTGGVYEWSGGYRNGYPEMINSSGLTAGRSTRFTPSGLQLGSAAWVYDPATGITTEVLPSFDPVTLRASVSVDLLTDGGCLLGTYMRYDANGAELGGRIFLWTAQTGVRDLPDLVAGGLAASGWQSLSYLESWTVPAAIGAIAPWGVPGHIVGKGRLQNSPSYEPFLLTIIPAGCYPNCDNSTSTPVLTANDFICFITKFAAADPYANCDQSTANPLLTANDFFCFLTAYAAGCS